MSGYVKCYWCGKKATRHYTNPVCEGCAKTPYKDLFRAHPAKAAEWKKKVKWGEGL